MRKQGSFGSEKPYAILTSQKRVRVVRAIASKFSRALQSAHI